MEKYINKVIQGECEKVLQEFPENSIDTIITDPPYGLSFMGKKWDYKIPSIEQWAECLRVAKPGATLLCFGGTRTYHRIACTIEDAGWVLKDCIMWIYGSGFPKATDISKQLDKKAGIEMKVGKGFKHAGEYGNRNLPDPTPQGEEREAMRHIPATEQSKLWNGWKSHGLKPAYEPIIVAVKPNDGSYADNALKWGVAGLNIDGGRVQTEENTGRPQYKSKGWKNTSGMTGSIDDNWKKGRYPANVIFDEEAGKMLDKQSGNTSVTGKRKNPLKGYHQPEGGEWFGRKNHNGSEYHDKGGASRFFYCAKASKAERNKGVENLDIPEYRWNNGGICQQIKGQKGNSHPTVKPLKLMEYLCTITKTPTGGIVLDPFLGSGTTAMACIKTGRDFIGIEKDKDYCEIAQKRIDATEEPLF